MLRFLLLLVAITTFISCQNDKAPIIDDPKPPVVTVDKSDSILQQLQYLDVDNMCQSMRTTSKEVLAKISGNVIFDTVNSTGERVVMVEKDMGGAKSLSMYGFLRSDSLERILNRVSLAELVDLKSIDKIRYMKNFSDKIFTLLNPMDMYQYSQGSLEYNPAWPEPKPEDAPYPQISELKRSAFWKSADKWIDENKDYNGEIGFTEYYAVTKDMEGIGYKPGNACPEDYKIFGSNRVMSFNITRDLYVHETPDNNTSRLALYKLINIVLKRYELFN